MEAQDIINNLNIIAEKIFKSVETQVFKTLDDIVLINSDILKIEPLKNIFFENKTNGLVIVANSLILFFLIYYILNNLISMYNGREVPNMYSYVIRIIFVIILVNSSYYICEQILNIFELFTGSIDEFSMEIINQKVSFENLKEKIISINDFMSSDLISLNGIIKGMISFGAVSVLINFSIRYVTIIFLIIISPLAFICLASDLSIGVFKSWIKILCINLFTQIIVKIIILIPIAYQDTSHTMYKIILVGSIYLIYKINNFTKELFVKFTSDIKNYNIF